MISRANFRPLIAAITGLVFIGLFYRGLWTTVADFVIAIDSCNSLFCDFVNHYYPMGQEVFSRKLPVAGYFYSPFFAILLSPWGHLQADAAVSMWGGMQVLTTGLLCLLPAACCVRKSPWQAVAMVLVFAISYPVLHNFKWGQISVLLTLCTLSSVMLYERGRYWPAVVLLAVATAIKYYPGIFALVYLLRRDFRSLAGFAVLTALLTVVVPALMLGLSSTVTFYQQTAQSMSAVQGWLVIDVNSQYMAHVLTRLSGQDESTTMRMLLRLLGLGIVGANGWLLWRCINAGITTVAMELILLFGSIPFVIGTSWPHYFVYLPVCQAAALWMMVGESRSISHLLVVASIILSSAPLFAVIGSWQQYNAVGCLFFANLCVLVFVYCHCLASLSQSERTERSGRVQTD